MTWGKRTGIIAGVAAFVLLRIFLLAGHFSSGAQIPGLIPQAEFPKNAAEARERSADLVTRFPADPRSHYFRAAKFLTEGDPSTAEEELRIALAERTELAALSPEFEPAVHGLLALTMLKQGRHDDAKKEAQQACDMDMSDYPITSQGLKAAGLCS